MNYQAPWIEITTCLFCKNNCSYCPQNVLANNYKGELNLSANNFKKILKNIPKNVIIDFAGFCEPFQNKECADMILYANEQGYKVMVWTTLVGLTDKDVKRIEKVPFLVFSVHDIGQEKRDYPFITDWHKAIPNSRAGNLYEEKRKDNINGCSRGDNFDTNVMLPNGDVVLCCQDYGLKHILGNLFKIRFEDLLRQKDYELCHRCIYAK